MKPDGRRKRKVLVVEDDSDLREAYRRFFTDQHPDEFSSFVVPDAEQALGVLRHESADLVVLDWGLPGISGASLAKALRSHALTRSLGILMVSGKKLPAETVFALDSGADDFLTKPFDWNIFLARLRSLSRRADLTLERRLTAKFPGLELDLEADRLTVDGRTVRLSPKEMELLRVFLTRPGIVHSQAFLWQAAWGFEAAAWDHTLSVTLSSLRGKLGSRWGARLRSHKGRGYAFELDDGA